MTRVIHNLPARGQIVRGIREFFHQRGYLEVETPCLIRIPSMEPHIDPFAVVDDDGYQYLRTSPEYALKKLLSEGLRNLFTLGPCFRNEPHSRLHHPEFTMLEWYASNRNLFELMDEAEDLIRALWEELDEPSITRNEYVIPLDQAFSRMSVSEAWIATLGFCPIEANTYQALASVARAHNLRFSSDHECYDTLFHQLFLNYVEPELGQTTPTFVWGWPASQAALARLSPDDPRIALRFELYAGGLELANAFDELTDPHEQKRRFKAEQSQRASDGKPVFPMDEELLDGLSEIPPTSGIALGVDRLVMLLLNAKSISEVRL